LGVYIISHDEYVKKVKEKHGDKVDIVSKYNGSQEPITLIYHCGKHGDSEKTINAKNVFSSSFQPCKNCDLEKKSKSGKGKPKDKQSHYDRLKAYCESKGGKLITEQWTRAKDIYEVSCGNPDHPNFFSSADSLVNKPQWCPYCCGRKGNFQEEIDEIIKSKNGSLLTSYVRACDPVRVMCNKHNYIWDIMPLNIKKGRWCPICNLPYSEKVVYDYLIEKGCIVRVQHTFDDLLGNNKEKLKYDFAILDKDFNLIQLIEVDDDEHRQNHKQLKRIKARERDIKKDEYCKIHNINLFRLEYRTSSNEDRKNFTNRDWYYEYIDNNLSKILITKHNRGDSLLA